MNSVMELLTTLGSEHVHFKRKQNKLGYTDLIKFDLTNKRVWNGDVVIIDNGEVVVDEIKTELGTYTGIQSLPLMTDEERQLNIEELYLDYKYSTPNKHSDYLKSNFKALTPDQMTTRQLLDGKNRGECRCRLESYVLFSDLSHLFTNPRHFFWKNNEGLVIFKQWS